MTSSSTESAEPSRLLSRFEALVAERPNAVALLTDHESVTYAQLSQRARAIAHALREHAWAGRRIALLSTQDSRWVEGFFGIALAGSVVVPLSHLHPEPERAWFVQESEAVAVLGSEDFAADARACAGERPVFAIESLRSTPTSSQAGRVQNRETALILYTSGTTGKPKGALITHGNLAWLAELVARAWEWNQADALLHALPLHHLHGLGISLFVSLLAGSPSRMLTRFDAARMWEEMAHATVLMGVPTMHKKLLDAFDAADAPTRARWRENARCLRLVTSGSAALPVSVGQRFAELTGSYPLERFGMTEIGVGLSNPLHGARVPGSCGLPFPGMRIRIVREDGTDAAPDEPGEIWIQGPTVFTAYDKNPVATASAFVDGWFKSGDVATQNAAGYVKILGRTSVDILKSGGYKLSALEIEEVVRDIAGIADVAVIGVPDETWGEIAVAVVIPQAGASLSEEAIRSYCKERIAAYKVPKRVILVEDFPRNPVGKVIKPELAKRVRAAL
ncbi:MAG TPA: AMP-binding protein [Polyangiaceae bacterium]|nr:AMP-binding protein [Polyangiaceae bacterium]